MTVGEAAKKMGVTVRTLQYYDKQGVLPPSAETEGGRRLYTDKDMIKLHQILSMKHLGFSLDDIKNRLVSMDSPQDVADILENQAAAIREKMESLSKSLAAIEALRDEVLQMQSVDFKKYADIIINLQMKNEFYWLIKYFDDQTLQYFRNRFDKESGQAMMDMFTRLQERAVELQSGGICPESEEGMNFAREYWGMVMEFTEGDMGLLSKLIDLSKALEKESAKCPGSACIKKQIDANTFIGLALDAYFTKLDDDPLGGGE